MRPAKIRAAGSESSWTAFWIAKNAFFFHADNEDSVQNVKVRMLIWVFVGSTCQTVHFLTFRLISAASNIAQVSTFTQGV